jgi:hypothetical protein
MKIFSFHNKKNQAAKRRKKAFADLKVRDPITVQYDPEGSQTHKVQIPAKR